MSSSSSEEEIDDHSIPINNIQVIFTIPDSISDDSILNEEVYITDLKHHQIIQSLISICINQSSFIINYSTHVSLPHDVCLYLLLNMTISKEIFLCRTIDKNSPLMDDDDVHIDDIDDKPSEIFIFIQSAMIIILMFIISMVYKIKNKRLVRHPINRNLLRTTFIACVGTIHTSIDAINPENDFILSSIEKKVLAAHDLTTIHDDHKFTNNNNNLIDIKKLTKRMSEPSKNAEHTYI